MYGHTLLRVKVGEVDFQRQFGQKRVDTVQEERKKVSHNACFFLKGPGGEIDTQTATPTPLQKLRAENLGMRILEGFLQIMKTGDV